MCVMDIGGKCVSSSFGTVSESAGYVEVSTRILRSYDLLLVYSGSEIKGIISGMDDIHEKTSEGVGIL